MLSSKHFKAADRMNESSVSVSQPPADFSCGILRQATLYVLELNHIKIEHENHFLWSFSVLFNIFQRAKL